MLTVAALMHKLASFDMNLPVRIAARQEDGETCNVNVNETVDLDDEMNVVLLPCAVDE